MNGHRDNRSHRGGLGSCENRLKISIEEKRSDDCVADSRP